MFCAVGRDGNTNCFPVLLMSTLLSIVLTVHHRYITSILLSIRSLASIPGLFLLRQILDTTDIQQNKCHVFMSHWSFISAYISKMSFAALFSWRQKLPRKTKIILKLYLNLPLTKVKQNYGCSENSVFLRCYGFFVWFKQRIRSDSQQPVQLPTV